MPRKKKEEIWKHFFTANNKSTKCKHCEKLYKVANVNKMEKHLQKCFRFPAGNKNQLNNSNEAATVQLCFEDSMSSTNSQSQMKETVSSPVQTTQSLEISEEKKKYLDQLLSKAIFVAGAPMSIVEHPLWVKFFEELQPYYKLPSRKAIATTHLEAIYNQMESEITEYLRSTHNLHLQCDGWSNQRVEGIFNFIIAKPEPYFVKSLNALSHLHNSQYLSQEILKVINNYGAQKFATLIGDNENNIQKAFDLVREVHPHIIPLRCVAHTLNLICEDCLKPAPIKEFVKIVVDTIKTVKRSQVVNALLTQIIQEKGSGESLKLPVKTRWESYCSALKSVQNTKEALQTLAVHKEAKMANEVIAHLLDETFWSMLDSCIKLIEPISDKIFKLEGNNINIHEVYMCFKDIKSSLNVIIPDLQIILNNGDKEFLNCINIRMTNCLKPIHFATYMLDPKSQGVELDEAQEIESLQFLDDMARILNINIMVDLANYRARGGFWGNPFVWRNVEDMHPVVWWKGICSSRILSRLAVRLLTAPCASAATERSFSVLGHAERNRLTTERAVKIAYVAYNWNLLEKQDFEMDDDDDITCPVNVNKTSTSHDYCKIFEFFDVNNIKNEDHSDSDIG